MSCGSQDCGCGCEDVVQLKIPSKRLDALKTEEIPDKGQDEKPAFSSKTPS